MWDNSLCKNISPPPPPHTAWLCGQNVLNSIGFMHDLLEPNEEGYRGTERDGLHCPSFGGDSIKWLSFDPGETFIAQLQFLFFSVGETFKYTFGKEVARQGFDTSKRKIWRMSLANEEFEWVAVHLIFVLSFVNVWLYLHSRFVFL